jgi:hypothetical protein
MSSKPLPSIFEGKETVNNRVRRYIEGKHALLSAAMQQKDSAREETRSVWYSKIHIETWLQEMNDLGANGMRIYFGEKEITEGNENNLIAQATQASGQLCLLMVLTRAGIYQDSHINIIYEDEDDYENRKNSPDANSLTDGERQFNFGGYSPPMSITEGVDFPDDSIS